MSINEVCNPDVVTITATASLQEAAKLMKENNIGALVVVNDQNKPCGVLTDRDMVVKILIEAIDISEARVDDIMCAELLTINENQDIREAIDAMCARGVRRAPIVNKAGEIVGITTVDDLLMLISDELNGLAELVCKQLSKAA